jgi:endonuclease/exonuclease/phosphatase family metal-dependent hydrolase
MHLGTWKIPGSNEVNQIDHVLVSLRHSTSIIDVMSSRGPNSDTDHYLVKTKVRERIASTQKMERVKPKKWDIQKLQEDKEIQQNYKKKIGEKIREYKEGNVEENCERIEEIIKYAADETVCREGNQGNRKWFDEECAKVVLEKNNARKRMLQEKQE